MIILRRLALANMMVISSGYYQVTLTALASTPSPVPTPTGAPDPAPTPTGTPDCAPTSAPARDEYKWFNEFS